MAIRGAQSFGDLRRQLGVTHVMYYEAYQAKGLLGDDSEWSQVFDETVVWATASQLRHHFVTILCIVVWKILGSSLKSTGGIWLMTSFMF